MSILDPGLKYLMGVRDRRWSRLLLESAFTITSVAPQRETANIMLEIDGGLTDVPEEVMLLGFRARTTAGRVFTGDIPRDAIKLLEGKAGLKRAEASRGLRNELNLAVPEARRPVVMPGPGAGPKQARESAGVIVGIIDTGIDFTHGSFRNEDGSTRILAIWDQSAEPRADEHSPYGMNYGVEYTRDRIDQALRGEVRLSHGDIAPFHGTHVAGIAAGNARPVGPSESRRFAGVAPNADLVVVANTRGRVRDPGTVGDSADTLDAIAYILRQAEEPWRPVVINLSLGDNIGPHDGTSLLEVGIANLVQGAGRVLVKSAGNEGDTRHHAEGALSGGVPQEVRFEVPDDEFEVIVDVWSSGSSPFEVEIVPPAGARSRRLVAPFEGDVRLNDHNIAFVDAQASDPVNGHYRTFVVLRSSDDERPVDAGAWALRLTGEGRWHAWIQRNSNAGFQQSTSSMTVSIPAASEAVICVGSYISDDRFTTSPKGALSSFSGRGPTRDGRRVPTLVAPGEEVTSAQPGGRFAAARGTSMSAAIVTGAVALLLGIKPRATATEIRECLERTARQDEFTGKVPNDDWGAGKLDIGKACNDFGRQSSPSVKRKKPKSPR